MYKVVYDMDDVINNLNKYVFSTLNLPLPEFFEIKSCGYTDEQKEKIISMYKDPETFRHLRLMPGARCITRAEKIFKDKEGNPLVSVWINTISLNADIVAVKKETVRVGIPGFDMSRMITQVSDGHKHILEDADYVIEDNIRNIVKYPSKCKKILIDKTHNQGHAYNIADRDAGITRVRNLKGAIRTVERDIAKREGYNPVNLIW